MTISAAAFGRRITWEDDEAHPGHDLSFKQSIEGIDTGILIRALWPKWIFEWAPTERIRQVRDGFAEFRVCSPQASTTHRYSLAKFRPDVRSHI